MQPREQILLDRSRPQTLAAAPLSSRVCRNLLCQRLQALTAGRLTIVDGEEVLEFGPNDAALRAVVRVGDPSFYNDVVMGGSLGVGESYVDGKWTCNDLYALFRIFARDRKALTTLDGGLATLATPFLKLAELLRQNTRAGSKRNIVAHYDLGNDFYKLMLDPSMMYSCALFSKQAPDLEAASWAKIDHSCQKLGLRPDMNLVEIGSGWGSFALRAAAKFGCNVTTVTISDAQYDYVAARIQAEDLTGKVRVLKQDYRDLSGSFDRLVSIEMIEAVGHRFYDAYFAKCQSLLNERGAFLIQAIVIDDHSYANHLQTVDFIQKYVFPGSNIPAISVLLAAAARTGDFRLYNMEDITRHYGPTLLAWRQNVQNNIAAIRDLGFGERFLRLWDFYLCYCAAGFAEKYLGNVQLLWARQGADMPQLQVAA